MVYAHQYFMSDSKDLQSFSIEVIENTARLVLKQSKIKLIDYESKGSDTLIKGNCEVLVKNEEYLDVYCEDIQGIVMSQSKPLDFFSISVTNHLKDSDCMRWMDAAKTLTSLHEILEKRDEPLGAKNVCLYLNDIREILMLLPGFQPISLETISVSCLKPEESLLQTEKLVNLEQWKRARFLFWENEYKTESHFPIEHLLHFSEFSINLSLISYKDLCVLKEALLLSKTNKEFTILDAIVAGNDMNEVFGNPASQKEFHVKWSLKSPQNGNLITVLNTRKVGRRCLKFRCATQCSLEEWLAKKSSANALQVPRKLNNKQTDNESSRIPPANKALNVFSNCIAMEIILKYIGFYEIQNLRRVSTHIRRCIDQIKPDPKINYLRICSMETEKIDVHILCNRQLLKLCYGVRKSQNHNETHFPSHQMTRELSTLLRNQKSTIDEIFLDLLNTERQRAKLIEMNRLTLKKNVKLHRESAYSVKFVKQLKTLFRHQKSSLKVKKLKFGNCGLSELMSVLPFLNPEALETIEIEYPMFNSSDLAEIAQLAQWKSARELIIVSRTLPIQLESLAHFANVDACLSMSSNDIRYLRNVFLDSESFVKWKITLESTDQLDDLYTTDCLGEPMRRSSQENLPDVWMFPMPACTFQRLHIMFHRIQRIFIFSRRG